MDQKLVLIMLHSGVGTTIFFMMLLRWWWRKSNDLYAPKEWWRRPSLLLQVAFYPLVLIQVLIGIAQAAFIDYDVLAFGFINYSALAVANEELQSLLLELHGWMAILLIALVCVHGVERSRILK